MTLHTVTSEIYAENKNSCVKLKNGNAVTTFVFKYPSYMIQLKNVNNVITYDNDGDLDIDRQKEGRLIIEHYVSTRLQHVGLQVWRGALLLADYILSNPDLFKNKVVLELGAGVGLTSIVASFLADEVICTDINVGEILTLIERNLMKNNMYTKSKVSIKELDFLNLQCPTFNETRIKEVDIILAADVIYDENITEGFVLTLAKLLNAGNPKVVYIALEKRYVFTTADMDTVAPMFEEFLKCIEKQSLNWSIKYLKIDFPQYFKYDRIRHMTLMKIENKLSV